MRMICPACGTSTPIPEEETGDAISCAGCGKRMRLDEPIAQPADDEGGEFDWSSIASSSSQSAYKKPKKKRQREWRRPVLAGLIGATLMATVWVLIVVFRGAITPEATVDKSEPTAMSWDREHRSDLLAMKASADSLAMSGKWRESYDAYQRIITFVGDHEVKDPVSLGVVDAVRPGQERAMARLVNGVAPTPAVAAAPAPAVGVVPGPATQDTRRMVSNATTTEPTVAVVQPSIEAATAAKSVTPALAPPIDDRDAMERAADNAAAIANPKGPPPSLRAYTLPDQVTDEEIGEAIDKGVRFLAGQFKGGEVVSGVGGIRLAVNASPKTGAAKTAVPQDLQGASSDLDKASDLGNLPGNAPPVPGRKPTDFVAPWSSVFTEPGIDALCVYALLNAGRAQNVPGLGDKDPFTEAILERLKSYDMPFTYHRSLRAAALAVFARDVDIAALEEDVRWLQAASMHGAYTYSMPSGAPVRWDNSNSQYGLLGVWSGAQASIAVSPDYWKEIEDHWNSCMNELGTWGYYDKGGGTLTMTCAGLASLLVASDCLDEAHTNGLAKDLDEPSASLQIDKGLTWLDTGDNCVAGLGPGPGGTGYGLYGLERVGLASGFKYFGAHDWYSELARELVSEQHFDGSWGGSGTLGRGQAQTLIDTSYALLFLARGRHPILFNKLRYPGPWNNRPHDAAHLARYAAKQLERPLNWQVVNLRRNWFDWMDCPVLYIAGDQRIDLTPANYRALRDFSDGGGIIFTHADGGSAEFNAWVSDLVRKIFPKYELMQVPRDHPIYSAVYPLKNPPVLLSVSNASRILLVHSPTDLSSGWQLNWTDQNKTEFQLGVNIFVYAAGKGNLKNRLASTYIPQDPTPPESMTRIARLQYASEWDPEPYAWTRFSRYFQWETHQGIQPVTVQLKELKPRSVPMAVLTGTVRHDFTEAEQLAARAYVQAGGVLVIDACGGQADFVKCVERTLLPQAFEGVSPLPIGPNHPLLIASRPHADDLTHMFLRGYANENGGKQMPILTIAYGKGWVIFSRLDITTGLLGTQSWGILGYDPAYAQALMKNAVLWAEARSPQPAAAATSNPAVPTTNAAVPATNP